MKIVLKSFQKGKMSFKIQIMVIIYKYILKNIEAETKFFLKNCKRVSWRKCCSEMTKVTPTTLIWKRIRILNNLKSPSRIIDAKLIERIHNTLAPPSESEEIKLLSVDKDKKHLLNEIIITKEFERALCLKKDNAPGFYEIRYTMLKNLPNSKITLLVRLFNDFIKNLSFPEPWVTQKIILVPKPNRGISLISSYRPIAHSSCIAKVFETILKIRLE